GLDPGHLIGLVHRPVGTLGPQDIASRLLLGIGSLSIAGDLYALGLGHAEFLQSLLGSQDEAGVAISDLGAVVGLQRQALGDVAIDAFDLHHLVQGGLHIAHLGVGILARVGVLSDRDLRQILLPHLMHLHVALHDLGE